MSYFPISIWTIALVKALLIEGSNHSPLLTMGPQIYDQVGITDELIIELCNSRNGKIGHATQHTESQNLWSQDSLKTPFQY